MVTVHSIVLLLAAFFIFEVGVYIGGELNNKKGDDDK